MIKSDHGENDTDSTVSKYSSRSKVGNVLISGVGFLADAFDLFVIDFVVAILSATSYAEVTSGDKSLVVSSTLIGAVFGQLFFGIAADYLGRRKMFVATASLVIFGSLSSSLIGWGYRTSILSFNLFHQLAICRFILGVGIGGEYPLSATVAAENETREELLMSTHVEYSKGCLWYLSHKPNSIAAVFSMQGVGMLLSPLLVMLCIACGLSLEVTWRICLSVGAIPSAIAFIFRWRMSETAAFQKLQDEISGGSTLSQTTTSPLDLEAHDFDRAPSPLPIQSTPKIQTGLNDQNKSTQPNPSRKRRTFLNHVKRSLSIIWSLKTVILGTSATWFLIDITLYGTGSFKSVIVNRFVQASPPQRLLTETQFLELDEVHRPIKFESMSLLQRQRDLLGRFEHRQLQSVTLDQTRNDIMTQAYLGSLVALLSIPGYILSLLFIHKIGTRRLQFWGFIATAIIFLSLGLEQLLTQQGIPALELILFGLTFLASNFGPNTTTFIIPTQVYPTILRATCHGFSAAMGKVGGVVGTSLFSIIEDNLRLGWLLMMCGVVAFVGAAFTLCIPKDLKSTKQSLFRTYAARTISL